jgi:Rod binding domain-containing protein
MTLAPLTENSAAIAKQARAFETMAISQLLAPIFDTVGTPSAAQMESDGGLGLAGQIAAVLKEKPVQ